MGHEIGAKKLPTPATGTKFDIQRERILKAAATCFNEKGYSGTSLKDVSRHLNLTDAALYYYVKNKEELVYLCYLRAADLGRDAMERAVKEGRNGLDQACLYVQYHVETMVGDEGPVAIMSEIPSLNRRHRNEILELSRQHSMNFERILKTGIEDGSIRDCNLRMSGNALMGAINWIPKWFHGDAKTAKSLRAEFPDILTAGLRRTDSDFVATG